MTTFETRLSVSIASRWKRLSTVASPSSGALTRAAMGRFLVSQIAAVAELEAGLIGQRTKAALAAAKARGGWRVRR
jgi:DNA invertase Pin-like site-specific DNA recombinase